MRCLFLSLCQHFLHLVFTTIFRVGGFIYNVVFVHIYLQDSLHTTGDSLCLFCGSGHTLILSRGLGIR